MISVSDGDPCVSRVEREPSQETFDQRGEYSNSIRVGIAGRMLFCIEERVNASGDVVTGVGRRFPVRMKGFTQRGFLAWAELVMEEFGSDGSDRISEIGRLTRSIVKGFV
jgi:hypothetical protein